MNGVIGTWGLVALVALAASGAQAGSPPTTPTAAPAARPNVLVITVDALRPDALGWVAGRNATPALDALALEGARFPAAVASAPLTLPSHTSIFTGLVPRRHGVRDDGKPLGAEPKTLAELLAARGYATAAFVSGAPLRALFGLDRGFSRYDDALPAGQEGWQERPAPQTTSAALEWVRRARTPWFLWVHYREPHEPYTPPPRFRGPRPRGDYDGEVVFADSEIGRLRAGLDVLAAGPTLTVFAGAHGESLGEHGENGHGHFVYDTTLIVPLVISLPGRIPSAARSASPRLVDLTPTVLELVGLPPLPGVDGVSLAALLAGKRQDVPPAHVESRQPWQSYGWAPLGAVRAGGWKLITAPRPELYDLTNDPGERTNLVAENPSKVDELLREVKRVEALTRRPSEREPPPDLPDPKDRILERAKLNEADALLRSGRHAEALPKLEAVLKTDPTNRIAASRSGMALLWMGNAAAAMKRLETAVALDPEDAEARFWSALARMRVGDFAGSVPHGLETVRLQPRRAMAWFNLGMSYGAIGKHPEALRTLLRAVELEPANGLFLASCGLAEKAAGRTADAIAHLKKAAAVRDREFRNSATLGLLLVKSGQAAEARDWLLGGQRDEPDFAEARFELAVLELKKGDRAAAKRALLDALAAEPKTRDRLATHPELGAILE